MFSKILVANRGEIARRVFLACQDLGIRSVAIHSEADADAAWLDAADERYLLPGVTSSETYLNQTAVFQAAKQSGAEAIHPGYGFMSENAGFAQACADHGLVFFGLCPMAIELMGSMARAREIAEAAGVPTIPGVDGATLDEAALQAAADEMGYPVLVKASAGGGGKGMRSVEQASELPEAIRAAKQEAQSAFGDSRILLEKYFTSVHHVEIQVLGDQTGKVLHLFERECSIQRRYLKIVLVSPAPVINDDAVRQAMAKAAVSLAEAVDYVGAGTVEFIADSAGNFYFLEMNTRLQVEHPISELVTGIDLVAWQIRVAAGLPLPMAQADDAQRGHALECRIYAEDPANHFLPSIGTIVQYERPTGAWVRVDDGIATGTAVTPYYDPMLAKIICWGQTREDAIGKMRRALEQTVLVGVTTNISYLLDILQEPAFVAGNTPTSFLDDHMQGWQPEPEDEMLTWGATAVFEALRQGGGGGGKTAVVTNGSAPPDPWLQMSRWRNV